MEESNRRHLYNPKEPTMTETERAIKDFEDFKVAGYTHCALPSSWHIELAITALRAQLARETIVRCGECKHSQQGTIYPTCLYCYNQKFNGNGFRVEADGFCSYGERNPTHDEGAKT